MKKMTIVDLFMGDSMRGTKKLLDQLAKKNTNSSVSENTFISKVEFNEEYSAEEKKRLGIPSNAVSKGGKWYVGDKYVGKVVDKKFVRVQQPKKTTTPKKFTKKATKKSKSSKGKNYTETIVDRVRSAKMQLYSSVYGGYDTIQAALEGEYGPMTMSFEKFSKITGLPISQIKELIVAYGKENDYPPIYQTYSGEVALDRDFWKTKPPANIKPAKTTKPKVIKLKGVEVRPDIDASFEPVEDVIRQTANIPERRIPITPEVKGEEKAHRTVIRQDVDLESAIFDWARESVWNQPRGERNYLFRKIDGAIKQNGMRVTSLKQLYRGMHFETKKSRFGKTILNTFKQGAVVKLPPSGFTYEPNIAFQFAEVGEPVLSVMYILQNTKQGIPAMHVWGVQSGYGAEREVITASGQYKILNVVMQKVNNSLIADAIHLTITLQRANVSETLTEIDESDNKETILDFLFGDSMRHTANNLKKLDGKKTTPRSNENTYISKDVARQVYDAMGYDFDFDEFVLGMNTEIEHQDITGGDLILTAKIAATHLWENPKYYTLLQQSVETSNEQLVGAGGVINAAPDPKDVKKTRKMLDKEKHI